MAFALTKINQTTHVAFKQNQSRPSLPYRPMMVSMSMSEKKSYWASVQEDIEAHLKRAIPLRDPLSVFEPMHHVVFAAAPPSTCPALCIAACELLGGHRDQALPAASALHVMHVSAFTHGQLPLSDRPSLVPTSRPIGHHHAFKPNLQLLLPDGIVPFGFELLAKSDDPAQRNWDRVLRVVIEMARAIGSQGMIDGQYHEIPCDGLDEGEWVNYICEKKEGGLHACGAACGAILGGGSEEEIEKLRRYGFYVGMIEGLSQRVTLKGTKKIEEFEKLALKELGGFKEAEVEGIASFVEVNSSQV